MQDLANLARPVDRLTLNGAPITLNGEPLVLSGEDATLSVTRVAFGSPGFTDFVGVGKIIEEIRIFIQFLVDRVDRRNLIKLEEEERRAQLERDKVRLRMEQIEFLEKHPNVRELLNSPQADFLLHAVSTNRVTSVSPPE